MAISPDAMNALSEAVKLLYEDAEAKILSKIATRLSDGIDVPGNSWQQRKAAELNRVINEMYGIKDDLDKEARETITEAVNVAYQEGALSATDDLAKAGVLLTGDAASSFGVINQLAVEALVGRSMDILETSHMQIVRRASDAYRSIITEAAGSVLVGVETRKQATQAALNRFADAGISTFVDKAGRNWDLASYAEMATRSATTQASIQGHVDRMVQQRRDLVIVSDHPQECSLCRPWERKILSISGNDPEYPPLSAARSAGLFHPNCGHTINAYIEGLTKVGTPQGDPVGYEARQKQRYMERRVRAWKRRKQVAITPEQEKESNAKIRHWQGLLRQHTDTYDLRRKPERERIQAGKAGVTQALQRRKRDLAAAKEIEVQVPVASGHQIARPNATSAEALNMSRVIHDQPFTVPISGISEADWMKLPLDRRMSYISSPYVKGFGSTDMEDPHLKMLLARQGYDGLPEKVSKADLDGHIASGEREMYRGIATIKTGTKKNPVIVADNKNLMRDFTDGDLFAGRGIWGNGTYTAVDDLEVLDDTRKKMNALKGYDVAYTYSGKDTTGIMRMSLKSDAKVIPYEEALERATADRDRYKLAAQTATNDDTKFENEYLAFLVSDPGRWAVVNGYDALFAKTQYYFNVLNRTALRIQTDEVEVPDDSNLAKPTGSPSNGQQSDSKPKRKRKT
jgi:hypothetical protein